MASRQIAADNEDIYIYVCRLDGLGAERLIILTAEKRHQWNDCNNFCIFVKIVVKNLLFYEVCVVCAFVIVNVADQMFIICLLALKDQNNKYITKAIRVYNLNLCLTAIKAFKTITVTLTFY